MFQARRNKTALQSAFNILELIFHSTVRELRKTHGNAIIGLLSSVMTMVIMVAVFYFLMELLGLSGGGIRGSRILFILTGVFFFLTHIQSVSGAMGAANSTSPMMLHAPMNAIIAICAAIFAGLYRQVLAFLVILFFVHMLLEPVEIYDPIGLIGPFLLVWLSGVAIGLVLRGVKPWYPGVATTVNMVYTRLNMIASGKMMVANALPAHLLPYFTWNPLFHIIDQSRGYAFINYNPHVTSIMFPIIFTIVMAVIGLMGDFYTRQYASKSWDAGR